MQYISRLLENNIKKSLFKGKIVILYGARQVGKTTLVRTLIEPFGNSARYLNCETPSVLSGLETSEPEQMKHFLGNYKLIVLDEAQKIPNVGIKLKLLVDTFPHLQIIATGSSSFDLTNHTGEPLTGRTFTFIVPPLSFAEIAAASDALTAAGQVEKLLRFGSYPEVFLLPEEETKDRLENIATNYLYKDILAFDGIKKSQLLDKLLKLLALQLGSEVSYTELANTLGVSRLTVAKYLDILEQAFIVYHLPAFSRNPRKEISKSIKVYFYNLGIRNTLLQQYNQLMLRADTGALWENFLINERRKHNVVVGRRANYYFWRTYTRQEIDLVEEREGKIYGFEFKYKKDTAKPPTQFLSHYPNAEFTVIHQGNFVPFVSCNR